MQAMRFSKEHLWVGKTEVENTFTLGITDYAQVKLGSLVFINLPEKGDEITEGHAFGDVESLKTVTDLIAPISGKIIEVNESLMDEPELVNEAPYENWLVSVELGNGADRQLENLLDEAAYLKYVETL